MVVGATMSVSMALLGDRRLVPVVAGAAAPLSPPAAVPDIGQRLRSLPNPRDFLARRVVPATALAVAGIAVVALVTMAVVLATGFGGSTSAAQLPSQGPPDSLRAGSGVAGNFERAHSAAAPPASELGALVFAGAAQHAQVVEALRDIAAREAAKAEQARVATAPRGVPQSLGVASGLAAGTVLPARITIYGCVGPGGGFCGGMSSGHRVFEGAAACSSNLPFGTRLRILGDPTGRIYECLDRGHLNTTWVDVFFYDTAQGMAWQSALGGTRANIEIVN
jgi:hypothetical protein